MKSNSIWVYNNFQGIQEDCDVIIVSLKCQLHSEFEVAHSTVQELATSTELLLQLGEDCEILSKEFLKGCTNRLGEQLVLLQVKWVINTSAEFSTITL